MEQLSDEQVDWISKQLYQDGSISRGLELELLDHFCCYIEAQMEGGIKFQQAFDMAFEAIAPNGTADIQSELDFLLNHDFQPTMKKIIYISGFVFSFSFSLNMLFRQMQWESGVFYFMTFFSLVIFLLPSIAIMAYRNRKMLSILDKFRMTLGVLSGMALGTGMIFKSFHFPTSNMLITIGTLMFAVGFLPIFFFQLYKRSNF